MTAVAGRHGDADARADGAEGTGGPGGGGGRADDTPSASATGTAAGAGVAGRALAARIQHTLIGQAVTAQIVREHVAAAVLHGFDAVIVPGSWVPLARRLLVGKTIRLGSILDFPYGSSTTAARVAGAAALVAAGVDEIDSTVNIGFLLSGRHAEFAADLAAVVQAAAPVGVKFMLELPLLDARQRQQAVDAAVQAGAAYVKNASRGAVGIADPASIAFLRRSVPDSVGVKASGGIKTVQQVRELLAAGADLIGTSSGVSIVTGERGVRGSLYSY